MEKNQQPTIATALTPFIKEEFPESFDSAVGGDKNEAITYNDPFNQLEGFRLFSYFTANIIKEEVIFTR